MTNEDMANILDDMIVFVEKHKPEWQELFLDRILVTAKKLRDYQELNLDDKKCIKDLSMAFMVDSTRMWPFNSWEFVQFDAVCEELKVYQLEYNNMTVQDYRFQNQQWRMMRNRYRYDVGLICSVRVPTDKEYIEKYVKALEDKCFRVFYPARDTDQNDDSGLRICRENTQAYSDCHEIHIIYNPDSQGSLFDIGTCFEMGKPISIVNPIQRTETKSFKNMLLDLEDYQEKYHIDQCLCIVDFNEPIEVR